MKKGRGGLEGGTSGEAKSGGESEKWREEGGYLELLEMRRRSYAK